MLKIPAQYVFLVVSIILCVGWVGVNPKPLEKPSSSLSAGQSGTYHQLSDDERKELVWMAKAAKAAYADGEKPLGYRSFSKAEWDRCSVGCPEMHYAEDGAFTVGSGLRGRLMVNMLNEGRVVLSLCGVDDINLNGGGGLGDLFRSKDVSACIGHYRGKRSEAQYAQALRLMKGVLNSKPRSHLWIVGHSLGGSLTTFLALELPVSRTNVKCATFNGYGYSPFMPVSADKVSCVKKRLRNIYADGDPVYNWKLSAFVGGGLQGALIDSTPEARHFGPSYSLVGEGDALSQHCLDGLLNLMIAHRTKWQGL